MNINIDSRKIYSGNMDKSHQQLLKIAMEHEFESINFSYTKKDDVWTMECKLSLNYPSEIKERGSKTTNKNTKKGHCCCIRFHGNYKYNKRFEIYNMCAKYGKVRSVKSSRAKTAWDVIMDNSENASNIYNKYNLSHKRYNVVHFTGDSNCDGCAFKSKYNCDTSRFRPLDTELLPPRNIKHKSIDTTLKRILDEDIDLYMRTYDSDTELLSPRNIKHKSIDIDLYMREYNSDNTIPII